MNNITLPTSSLQQQVNEPVRISDRLFNLSRIMHYEKIEHREDCFCVIYGRPRSGKSMLELQLVRNEGIIETYEDLIFEHKIKDLSDLTKLGVNTVLPKSWWKNEFKNHFGFDTEDTIKRVKRGGYNYRISLDEGGTDVATWMGGMNLDKEAWNKLIVKIGEYGNTFFFITASISLLDKNTLRRAKWLMIIAKPHEKNSNSFYLYKQWDDPIRAEKNPFDLNDVFEKIDKFKHLPTDQIYKRSKCYKGEYSYPWINPKVYQLYLKMVKHPQMLMTDRKNRKYVPIGKYEKLMNYAALMTYNLNNPNGDDKSFGQIRKLAMTNKGKFLVSDKKLKELAAYGENLFYRYADLEEKLDEKAVAEKKEAYMKAKEEAKKKEEELKELEKLKEEKEVVSFRAFGRRSVADVSVEDDDVPDIEEEKDKDDTRDYEDF